MYPSPEVIAVTVDQGNFYSLPLRVTIQGVKKTNPCGPRYTVNVTGEALVANKIYPGIMLGKILL